MPLDGHSIEATCLCRAYAPYLLHVDPLHVWIREMGGVRRIPLGGGELELIAYYGASDAAIDDTRAFIVVPYAAFSIPSRAPLTGGNEDVTNIASGAIECIAIDERYVYTSEHVDGPYSRYSQAVRIMRRPKSGGEGVEIASFHERLVELQAARGMVFASAAGGPVYSVSRDGGPVHELADTFGNELFAVEGDSLFVCDKLAKSVREFSVRGDRGRIVAKLPPGTSIAKAFTVAGGFAYFGEIRESYRERDYAISRVRLTS